MMNNTKRLRNYAVSATIEKLCFNCYKLIKHTDGQTSLLALHYILNVRQLPCNNKKRTLPQLKETLETHKLARLQLASFKRSLVMLTPSVLL